MFTAPTPVRVRVVVIDGEAFRSAMELMKSRDFAITEVAEEVGFRDLRTFERAFKKYTLTTPREFKKSVVPKKEWTQLYELLEKWNDGSEASSHPRLSGNELECLTLGLLWETLLITECERRFS